MGQNRNITLSLPYALLKQIKRLAADRESERSRPCNPLGRSTPMAVPVGRATNSMSVEKGWKFVDANVLVYAYDASAGAKRELAAQLLVKLWDAGTGCLRVQVLQEFFVTIARRVAQPLPIDAAADRVREFSA